jgi:hypothetical protein
MVELRAYLTTLLICCNVKFSLNNLSIAAFLMNIEQKWMIVLEILTQEMGLRKLDIFMISLAESTQRSYKGGWSHFVSFFIEQDEPFPNWKYEDECIIVFGDFITWAADNIKLSEINIA